MNRCTDSLNEYILPGDCVYFGVIQSQLVHNHTLAFGTINAFGMREI